MIYETRNLENINKLAPHTKAAALKWYDFCKKNGIEVLIYETTRTIEEQRENIKKGVSWTMKSYHLVGQALDFVPVDSKGNALWDGYSLPQVQKAIQYAKSIGFEWGGDWNPPQIDKPHLQYNYKGYGTDKPDTVQTSSVSTKSAGYKIYTVQKGDTLSGVFGNDWKRVAELNGIKPPYIINVGQKLKY
jgi:peptidoglycan L-alanyl-D-glutamate endopeptidase CwlK